MRPVDRLYTKDETIIRSIHIDEDLYSQIQYLSENVFGASVSKIINVCIENTLSKNKNVKFYKKPINTESIYRSIVLRKTFYYDLIKIKNETGISFSRLLNGCIKEFLDDYKQEFGTN